MSTQPNKVKQLRKENKLTQEELSSVLNVSADYVSMIERGRTPSFKLAKKISDLFGLTVDEIFFANTTNKTFDRTA